jgi:oligopeptide transport system substrate-binding protein
MVVSEKKSAVFGISSSSDCVIGSSFYCLFVVAAASPRTSEDILSLWDSGPITLDPAMAADFSSYTYIVHIFSGLVRLDHELEIVPDIAESWEKSPDGKTYTFYLRQGVKFHSGREVKAVDFKYAWERACHPDTGSGTALTYLSDIVGAREVLEGKAGQISGVEVIGDYTLRVAIDAPRAYFLSKLAYPTAFVVDRANVESRRDWWREPNGTGPFKLNDWRTGEWLVLERNEAYYGDPAKLQQVVYYLTGAPMAMYELGQIDVVPVYGGYIYQVRDETSPFHPELVVTPELSLHYIGFNTAEPPFDDVNVRRAFSHAVDKERIGKLILREMVSEAKGILPPGMPGYNEALEGLDYDVEKAKELMAASRYGDASNLPPITLTVTGYGNYIPDFLGAIIEEWQRNLGVAVSVRQLEPEHFLYDLKQERDEMFMLGWIADYPDPHNFLDILFYTGSENNAFEYSNSVMDDLIDQAAVEQDDIIRLAMYQQAEQMVVDDAPCLPLWHGANYILVRPHVKGYELSLLGVPDLSQVHIDKT